VTTAARKEGRRRAKPAVESTVYDGSLWCGTITPKAGSFVARLTTGKLLGKFANERLAQRAITAAARAAHAPQPQQSDVADGFAWRPGELVVGQGRGDRPGMRERRSSLSESGVSRT
jgi:hypothetical protein